MNEVIFTLEVKADNGTEGKVIFETKTGRIRVEGEVYPWAVREVMDFIERRKDILKKTT